MSKIPKNYQRYLYFVDKPAYPYSEHLGKVVYDAFVVGHMHKTDALDLLPPTVVDWRFGWFATKDDALRAAESELKVRS